VKKETSIKEVRHFNEEVVTITLTLLMTDVIMMERWQLDQIAKGINLVRDAIRGDQKKE